MTIIGEAFIAVKPDTQGFGANAESGVLSSVTGIAKKAATILGGAFAAQKGIEFLKGSVEAARESNAVAAQTAAAIKSTGGAANVTAKEIDALANSISRKTGIDDEAIGKAENLLLTFTNVRNEAGKGNDIFNQATGVLADMSKALGTDVSGSAIQLGKALNDPIAGISALSRVGVTFNDEQKKTIENLVKTGKTAEAQKIILAELGKEFGGSAEAQATASDKLKVAFGNIQEEIGNKLIPIIDKVAGFIADKLPGAMDTAGAAFGRIRDIIKPIIDTITPLFSAIQGGLSGEGVTSDGLFGKFEAIGVKIREVIAGVQETFAGVVAFVQENGPKFEEAFSHIVNAIQVVFEALEPIITPIIEIVVNRIKTIITIMQEVVGFVLNIINGDFAAAFGNIKNIIGAVVEDAIFILKRLPGLVLDVLSGLAKLAATAALNVGKAIIEGIGRGLASAAGLAGDIASGVLRAIKNIINTQVVDRLNSAIPNSLGAGPFKVDLPDNPIPRLAKGALIKRTPGGIIANIAEGQNDEAVLPLPPGVIEGLQRIAQLGADAANRVHATLQPLVGQMVLQGATIEAAEANAISILRELRAEAWRQGK